MTFLVLYCIFLKLLICLDNNRVLLIYLYNIYGYIYTGYPRSHVPCIKRHEYKFYSS